jgi:PAS domain S-box-containing protein
VEKLYTYINNTQYLKSKIVNNLKNSGYSSSFQEDFTCSSAIKKISNCIVDYIEGKCHLENETLHTEISYIIINNMLKYIDKLNIGFIITTFKCYRRSYIDLILEEGSDYKSKLKIANYVERFFDKLEISACSEWLSIGGKVKKTEDALRESENRYRKLLEVMPDAVYVHSDGKIVYTNKAGAKLMGYLEPEEILGKSSNEFLEIDDYNKTLIKQQDDITMRNGYLSPVERKYFRKSDGKFLEVETTSTVMSNEEENTILDITRDISERKRIEFLKQKVRQKTLLLNKTIEYNKLRTEFFANISHELRTPLNMILGSVQLVNIANGDDLVNTDIKVKKYMSIIKQNCYRLVRLVDNLIDITKIDAGYLEISLQNEDIVKVVEDIVLSVVEYVESKGLELIFDTDIEEKHMAFDSDKIERIMLNLISNAIKFTKIGGYIYVNIYDKQDTVIISVRDTGIGIPQEKHKEIFERFIQIDKSLSRKREGSGIGLSLVKSLVEMHEGKIYLNKEITNGSEFVIELPARVLDNVKESNENYNVAQNYIERIKVEFSDIYS